MKNVNATISVFPFFRLQRWAGMQADADDQYVCVCVFLWQSSWIRMQQADMDMPVPYDALGWWSCNLRHVQMQFCMIPVAPLPGSTINRVGLAAWAACAGPSVRSSKFERWEALGWRLFGLHHFYWLQLLPNFAFCEWAVVSRTMWLHWFGLCTIQIDALGLQLMLFGWSQGTIVEKSKFPCAVHLLWQSTTRSSNTVRSETITITRKVKYVWMMKWRWRATEELIESIWFILRPFSCFAHAQCDPVRWNCSLFAWETTQAWSQKMARPGLQTGAVQEEDLGEGMMAVEGRRSDPEEIA